MISSFRTGDFQNTGQALSAHRYIQRYVPGMTGTGQGRFDIQMRPLRPGLPGILIELKAEKYCTEGRLAQLAAAALEQMDERGY